MTTLAMPRHVPRRLAVSVAAAGVAALIVGSLGLHSTPVEPLPDLFGRAELVAWVLLGVASGGLVFGRRDRRPPILASGLVGSAALLGAGPASCATVAVAGALGGLLRTDGLRLLRTGTAALGGWALPGVLALAAGVGGPVLGRGHPIPEVVALWVLLALGVPVLEALGTRLVLAPAATVDVPHMLRRRLEPQTVLAALAVVTAMAYASIGAAAGLIVLLPAAAARIGFARHDDGRRAVSQTLAAMTVLPEWVGIVGAGHTGRVRDVVEAVALRQGLPSPLRRDLVRAAELHELGHLDGGVVRGDRGRVVRSGAAVLEQAGMREQVVAILAACDPDRPAAPPEPLVARAAAVLTGACELDRTRPLDTAQEAVDEVEQRAAALLEAPRPWSHQDRVRAARGPGSAPAARLG